MFWCDFPQNLEVNIDQSAQGSHCVKPFESFKFSSYVPQKQDGFKSKSISGSEVTPRSVPLPRYSACAPWMNLAVYCSPGSITTSHSNTLQVAKISKLYKPSGAVLTWLWVGTVKLRAADRTPGISRLGCCPGNEPTSVRLKGDTKDDKQQEVFVSF